MARIAWTLTDNSTGTPVVLEMVVNPNEFDPPNRRANIKEEMAVAANGAPVLFQGRDQVRRGSMTGLVNSSQQFSDLDIWASKWYPLVLTDDLNNSWIIIITEITWKRLRRAVHPHRYDYTIEFLVVG
jgi:hypothetical protein